MGGGPGLSSVLPKTLQSVHRVTKCRVESGIYPLLPGTSPHGGCMCPDTSSRVLPSKESELTIFQAVLRISDFFFSSV